MKTKQNQFARIFIRAITTAVAVASATALPTAFAAYHLPSLSTDPRFYSWMLNEKGSVASVSLEDGKFPTKSWNAIDDSWPQITKAESTLIVGEVPADITSIDYTDDDIFVSGSGLASYIMGPWHGANGGTTGYFEFRPIDRSTAASLTGVATLPTVKIPRFPKSPASAIPTGLGPIGVWVNGTAVYGPMSGKYYKAPDSFAPGIGIWNEDAVWAESGTFDVSGFHQDMPGSLWGQHHCHGNPQGIRHQLNDHIRATFNKWGEATRYDEFPPLGQHSPILGWAFDGWPIYGPYGYTDPLIPSKGVSRMRSGWVLRDGSFSTRNLYHYGRDQLPHWAAVVQNRPYSSSMLNDSEKGPSPGTAAKPDPNFPLGCFIEDWDYRGSPGIDGIGGQDYDLDEFNGRLCRTPEFPNGTYAYFVALDEDKAPQFPYIIGPWFKGDPKGGEVKSPASSSKRY